MTAPACPKCESSEATKSGVVNNRQRFKCRACGYHYTVAKIGREVDTYYVIKALQLYIEGVKCAVGSQHAGFVKREGQWNSQS